MNILFVTSAEPQAGPFSTAEKRPPLGQGYLISLARERGHNVFFIDNYLRPSKFLENGYLQEKQIDFFGIYANTICFGDTLRMVKYANDLRERGSWNGKIIVGGPHTTVAVDTIPEYVDFVVQGEGEQAILDILEGKETRRVIKNEPMKELDWLPFEPWDIFANLPYDFTSPFSNAYPTYTMNTSRGCPFNCAFCSVDSIWGRRYTYYSAERIVAEVEYLVNNYGAKGIYFREDNFTLKKDRVTQFCNLLLEKKIKIDWACETRVESLCDEDFVQLMQRAGCKGVYLGVESVNESTLKRVNKKINKEQIATCINNCRKNGINTYCSLITGLPGETYKQYKETKKFMEEIKPYSFGFNVFVGIPRSDLYNEVEKNNLYEYRDKQDLLYLPGYDIRCWYFYGTKPKYLRHKFSVLRRSAYDWKLWCLCIGRECRRFFSNINTKKMYLSKIEEEKNLTNKLIQYYNIMNKWLKFKQNGGTLADYFEKRLYKEIAIYGMKELGIRLMDELINSNITVKYIIDKNIENIPVNMEGYLPTDNLPEVDAIIVTASYYYDEIEKNLREKVKCPILSIEELFYIDQ